MIEEVKRKLDEQSFANPNEPVDRGNNNQWNLKKAVFLQHHENNLIPAVPSPPTPTRHSPQCTEKVGVLPDYERKA